jgi:hypothetical protein
MTNGMVGFSQRIRLEWLEHAAALLSAGHSRTQIEEELDAMLAGQHSTGSSAVRSQRDKTITVLVRTWVAVDPTLAGLRDAGLRLMVELPAEQHIIVHWGMTSVTYPFFGLVAETVGRLLRLQGTCSADQVRRRIQEQLGLRDQVLRATRRAVRSFVDWGALRDSSPKGTYLPAEPIRVSSTKAAAWLVEACLRSSGAASAPLQALAGSPMLFPFVLPHLTGGDFSERSGVDVQRTGLDVETVILRQ